MSAHLEEVMEHRWGTRIALDRPARLQAAGCAQALVKIGNASLSGAYLRTRMPLPLLSKVWVQPRGGDAWIEACVVRHDGGGMGIEWIEPALPAVVALIASRVGQGRRGGGQSATQPAWQLPRTHPRQPPDPARAT